MILPLKLKITGRDELELSLRPAQHPSRFSVHDGVLWFDLPKGVTVHLISGEPPDLSSSPARSEVILHPATPYQAHWSTMLHGGQAALWWIEYDLNQRLCHWTKDIHQGKQQYTWTAHRSIHSSRLAIQLRGAGHMRIERILCTEV